MQAALERHGVERHDPPAGARFDPSLHEAMFTAPLSDGAAPGTVSSVFRPGYTLHGSHILRAAQVGVFVGEAQQQPPPDADAEGEGEAAAAAAAAAATGRTASAPLVRPGAISRRRTAARPPRRRPPRPPPSPPTRRPRRPC
mmetsp:Transcript_8347/g.24760  ORF Transcript_8347/g.24760 Transcript_8347/m.24760 type:complete len:142 (-) Transcript_8347:323-748(-)